MDTSAIVFDRPRTLRTRRLALTPPTADDVVVDVCWSGISTGTERLLWSGTMPEFPGLGYPLVPGYETVGRVAEAGARSGRRAGELVFVPGTRCFPDARCLFGGTAARLVATGARALPVDDALGERAALLALAATAHHAIPDGALCPELIVGHGALGRLVARLVLALGGPAPTVWETNPARRDGATGYVVCAPDDDPRRDYGCICDVSGDASLLDTLVARLRPDGELVLAGFYHERLAFDFAPAFLRSARLRVSAEWRPNDLAAVAALVHEGRLSLDGLLTHTADARHAADAYRTAFEDATCVKLVLDWRHHA
ncbi:MAG: chlorophyll synthesis pathway protein BchC [Gemmatirosa sp.]